MDWVYAEWKSCHYPFVTCFQCWSRSCVRLSVCEATENCQVCGNSSAWRSVRTESHVTGGTDVSIHPQLSVRCISHRLTYVIIWASVIFPTFMAQTGQKTGNYVTPINVLERATLKRLRKKRKTAWRQPVTPFQKCVKLSQLVYWGEGEERDITTVQSKNPPNAADPSQRRVGVSVRKPSQSAAPLSGQSCRPPESLCGHFLCR